MQLVQLLLSLITVTVLYPLPQFIIWRDIKENGAGCIPSTLPINVGTMEVLKGRGRGCKLYNAATYFKINYSMINIWFHISLFIYCLIYNMIINFNSYKQNFLLNSWIRSRVNLQTTTTTLLCKFNTFFRELLL